MNPASSFARATIAFAAALLLLAAGSASALAGDPTASITIHKSTCPANTGSDIFERCHDNALSGIDFLIGNTAVTTNKEGHATAQVASGNVTITENPNDAADFVGAYVFCSVQGTGKVLTDGRVNDGDVTIATNAGDDVICDWYNLTNQPAPTATATRTVPQPTATATTPPVVHPTSTPGTITLPNTGAGDSGSAGNSLPWIALTLLSLGAVAFTLRRRSALR